MFKDGTIYLSKADAEKIFKYIEENKVLIKSEKVKALGMMKRFYYLEQRKVFLGVIYKLEQRQSEHKLCTLKEGILREIAKYL